MTDQNLPPEPTGYAATAADLRRIADALDKLPTDGKPPYLMLSILPSAKTVEAVDAVTLAVLGKPGETRKDSDDWRHIAEGRIGTCYLQIHSTVPGPPDERDDELARLRAEVESLRAQSGLAYSRADEGEHQQPTAGRIPPHFEDGRAVVEVAGGLIEVDGECPSAWHVNDSERTRCPICGESD